MRHVRRSLLAAAAFVALAHATAQTPPGTVPPATPARSLVPPAGALLASGPQPGVAFFFSGDVIGYIDPCG